MHRRGTSLTSLGQNEFPACLGFWPMLIIGQGWHPGLLFWNGPINCSALLYDIQAEELFLHLRWKQTSSTGPCMKRCEIFYNLEKYRGRTLRRLRNTSRPLLSRCVSVASADVMRAHNARETIKAAELTSSTKGAFGRSSCVKSSPSAPPCLDCWPWFS